MPINICYLVLGVFYLKNSLSTHQILLHLCSVDVGLMFSTFLNITNTIIASLRAITQVGDTLFISRYNLRRLLLAITMDWSLKSRPLQPQFASFLYRQCDPGAVAL